MAPPMPGWSRPQASPVGLKMTALPADLLMAFLVRVLSHLHTDLATRLIPRLPASSGTTTTVWLPATTTALRPRRYSDNNRPATCDGTSPLKHPAPTRLDFGRDQHQEASRREARRPQLCSKFYQDPILKLATRSESVPRASRVGKYEVKASATACINDET